MLWAPHLGKKRSVSGSGEFLQNQNVWGWNGPVEVIWLNPPAHVGPPGASCPGLSRQLLNISKNEYFWVSRSAPPIPLWICYWRSRWYTNMHNASLKTCKWTQELWFEPHPSEHYFAVVCNQPKSHLCLSSPAFKKKSDFLLTQLRELAPCQVTETPAWARRRDWNCMTRGEMRSRQDYCSLCLSMT